MAQAIGVTEAIKNRLARPITTSRAKLPSLSTGSGTPAVYHPPTVEPPPNTQALVQQQLASSTQLATNTDTGSGIGAGRTSPVKSVLVPGAKSYIWLGALVVLLGVAVAWDAGKL
jgi:hypothetical protein